MANQTFIIIILIGLSGLFDSSGGTSDKSSQEDPITLQSLKEESFEPVSGSKAGTAKQISKHIGSILQDKNGYFWFATDGDGVCRYDGKSFTYFTEKEGLCSNYVWTITEDKIGNIWFTTSDGICRYDGKSFTNLKDLEEIRFSLMKPNLEYKPGCLWFGSRDGVYRYDGASVVNFTIHPASYHPEVYNNSRPYSVYCLLEDKSGNLWFGTEQRGVCRYDG